MTATKMTVRAMGAACALLVIVGCSSTADQVSEQIAEEAKDQLDLAELPEVTCPEDAEADDGTTFECTVTLEGDDLPVRVRFSDDQNFTIDLQGAAYPKDVLLRGLTEQLAQSDIEITDLDCPGEDLVTIAVDEEIDCTATDEEGTTATLVVGLDESQQAVITDIVTD